MKGFRIHTSMWTMSWDAARAARAIDAARTSGMDFLEIAHGLSVCRPVAESAQQVVGEGLPYPDGKAAQYGLI